MCCGVMCKKMIESIDRIVLQLKGKLVACQGRANGVAGRIMSFLPMAYGAQL